MPIVCVNVKMSSSGKSESLISVSLGMIASFFPPSSSVEWHNGQTCVMLSVDGSLAPARAADGLSSPVLSAEPLWQCFSSSTGLPLFLLHASA